MSFGFFWSFECFIFFFLLLRFFRRQSNLFAFALILDTDCFIYLFMFLKVHIKRSKSNPWHPVYRLLIKFFFSSILLHFFTLKLWNSMRETWLSIFGSTFYSVVMRMVVVDFKGRMPMKKHNMIKMKPKKKNTKNKKKSQNKFSWCARKRSMYDMRLDLLHRYEKYETHVQVSIGIKWLWKWFWFARRRWWCSTKHAKNSCRTGAPSSHAICNFTACILFTSSLS